MSESLRDTLRAEARALPLDRIRLRGPLHVLTGEALDVARFFERYYQAERTAHTGRLLRPGLESLGRLSPITHQRLVALVEEVQAAQSEYELAVDASDGVGSRMAVILDDEEQARARFVIGELTAALDYLLGETLDDGCPPALFRVQQAHVEPVGADALAGALEDYAGLAAHYRQQLAGCGDFDAALIDEATTLAARLRERSARGRSTAALHAHDALQWRNRLATLLHGEVAMVRRAARFVFRHHPYIRREVGSATERHTWFARRQAGMALAHSARSSA